MTKKNAVKDVVTEQNDTVKLCNLMVKSKASSFIRCGIKFHSSESLLNSSDISNDDYNRILNDPDLICREAEKENTEE